MIGINKKYKMTLWMLVAIASSCLAQEPQCFTADNSIWDNPWLSCTARQSPHPDYEAGHWLKYNFGEIRTLSKTRIWNVNDSRQLGKGIKSMYVDYSINGTDWIHWGTYNLEKGTGETVYAGSEGPDLTGIQAQFVLLSAIDNYGDVECMGLSEIKFYLLPGYEEGVSTAVTEADTQGTHPHLKVFPNPATDKLYVPHTSVQGQPYRIYDLTGRPVKEDVFHYQNTSIDIEGISRGAYILEVEGLGSIRFVKI